MGWRPALVPPRRDGRGGRRGSLDPADGDTAHGLIDLGIGMPELGMVKLSDLASIVGPQGQPVMRDCFLQPTRRLSEYLRLAEENGSMTD